MQINNTLNVIVPLCKELGDLIPRLDFVKKLFKKVLTNVCRFVIIFRHSQNGHAGVAHLVERNLAKVEVASSSLVTRSNRRG